MAQSRQPSLWPHSISRGIPAGSARLGYVEGQNLAIEYRAELVRLHVDVILAPDTLAALTAKQATSTIPSIMAGIGADPVAAGLVASLARPGGNVTGVTVDSGKSWGKGLELLKEAVPRLARVAYFWDQANPASALNLGAVQAAALAMGVQLHPVDVRDANAFEHAFAEIAKEPPTRSS